MIARGWQGLLAGHKPFIRAGHAGPFYLACKPMNDGRFRARRMAIGGAARVDAAWHAFIDD